MKRIIVGGLVGGIVFFIWSAIIHMSPLGMMGITSLPDGVYDTLKADLPNSGFYFFPGVVSNPTPEQQKAWEEKLKAGPYGILVYTAGPGAAMAPKQLIGELLSDIVAAFIASCIIAMIAAPYVKRAAVVALLGVFGWVSLLLSYWIWYNFPTVYILGEGFGEIVGWFIAGLVIAKLVPPRPQLAL